MILDKISEFMQHNEERLNIVILLLWILSGISIFGCVFILIAFGVR